ncbi:MAG TPA: DUF1254 domain-containing protein [Micropepsaceae bacterium]|nr:DUF1254 domain-containing protein [Micropepsaceae bacterium]
MTWGRMLILVIAIAAATHVIVLQLAPSFIMDIAMERIVASGQPSFAPRADENSRAIVKPSPDLLYAACSYDLAKGPMTITTTPPSDTYWSAAFYTAETDNYFVMRDGPAVASGVTFIVYDAGTPLAEAPPGAILVESPTRRGLMLMRSLVNDDAREGEIDAARRKTVCSQGTSP